MQVPPSFEGEAWFAKPDTWPPFEHISLEKALWDYGRNGRMDVILLVSNEEEFKAAIQRFCIRASPKPPSVIHKANMGATTVYLAVIGDSTDPLGIGIIAQAEEGAFAKANVVNATLDLLNPIVLISVGVGWGVKEAGTSMGDVIISKHLVDFTDNAHVDLDGRFSTKSERPGAGKLLLSRFSDAARPRQWHFKRY